MNKLSVRAAVLIVFLLVGVQFAGAMPQGAPDLSGKVVETIDSGGYTYVQIDNSGIKTWVAVPKTNVKKGQSVSFYPGQVMYNFRSKTLNRTFDTIYFSGGMIQ